MSVSIDERTDDAHTKRGRQARRALPIPPVESPLEETIALACQLWLSGFIAGILLGLLTALLGIDGC